MEAGHYEARYIFTNRDGVKEVLGDMVHTLQIHSDGTITESRYETALGVMEFNPARVWDKSFLKGYELLRIG